MTDRSSFTVFGAGGFIGGHLARHLVAAGHRVSVPGRDVVERSDPAELADLGHVVYAIGLTGDFRSRPFDTVAAHVEVQARLLARSRFDSWLTLSSTRVYAGLDPAAVAIEDAPLPVRPSRDTLYDLSKLTAESLCLGHDDPGVRVARLSNVCGAGQSVHTFLGSLLDALARRGEVTVGESPDSSKDYVMVDDVVTAIERICLRGRERIYNVAGGTPTPHRELAARLEAVSGGAVVFEPGAPTRGFPVIGIDRLRDELGIEPRPVAGELGHLWQAARSAIMDDDRESSTTESTRP